MKRHVRVALFGAALCLPLAATAGIVTSSGTVYRFDFQNDGFNGNNGDWAFNSFKGECETDNLPGSNSGMHGRGVSVHAAGFEARPGETHALLCSGSGINTDELHRANEFNVGAQNGFDDMHENTGDWDFGFCKWECDRFSAITGLAEKPDTQPNGGGLTKARCSPLADPGTHSFILQVGRCRAVTLPNQGSDTNDWDPFYNKVECEPNEYMAGISVDCRGGNFNPHALLCCR